ncbi:interference hedgehog-like [Daktulosphaira vitifoliae]|uniref:interference hedgehog-like n=1 Tax=Daktulosphaira vitifoliae TaxID=58002 RepID=UPI0021AAD729|nr:interference hedgehog-like [Daktulosphaira vitifoliae]
MRIWRITVLIFIILKYSKNTLGKGIGIHFNRSPESLVAPLHDEVIFDCALNITPDNIKWLHNSKEIPALFRSTSNNGLVVKVDDITRTGDYQCVAIFGSAALISTAATLSLATLKEFNSSSLCVNEKITISTGNTISLNCGKPIQSDPPALIQYYKNGEPLSRTPVSTAGSILLKNVKAEQSGVYTCSATNNIVAREVKSPMSLNLDFRSSFTAQAPQFITKPPSLYIAQKNSNISIECAPYGEPVPTIQWFNNHKTILINNNKTTIEPGLLTISNLSIEDSGVYECFAENVNGRINYEIKLEVQESPNIKNGPNEPVIINEGTSEILKCEAVGTPTPKISWYLNGEILTNNRNIIVNDGVLTLNNTPKNYSGFIQCFACNTLGCSFWSSTLQVNPKQIMYLTHQQKQQHFIDDNTTHSPQRDRKDRTHKGKNRRKEKKKKEMIPPSKPNVTRLTENSVMVRWYVPPNNGLEIRFFKVQYKEVGAGGIWNTSSDDIPMHIRCYQVDKLLPERKYIFRVAAVYSNDDHKLGSVSEHFFLNKGPPNRSLIPPTLVSAKPVNNTSILLEWQYLNSVLVPVQGFYVYYRATSTAGDYTKAIVDGQDARTFIVTHLSPNTSYDIKMQSFTVREASNFSAIFINKTYGELKSITDNPKWIDNTIENNNINSTINGMKSLYVLLGAIALVVGAILLLIFFLVFMYSRRVSSQTTELNKSSEAVSGLEPLSMNGFALNNGKIINGCAVPITTDHNLTHNNQSNGYIIHPINITNNPLAPDAKNAIEISYLTNHNNNCSENEINSLSRRAMPIPPDTPRTWRSKDTKEENYV